MSTLNSDKICNDYIGNMASDEDRTTSQDASATDIMMEEILDNVRGRPEYAMSMLRIGAYRDNNNDLRDDFRERLVILDNKYRKYATYSDSIQVSIIVLAAIGSFLQAGNMVFGLSDVVIQFVTLVISAYTGLVLSISKYKKLDERREEIHNLRQQHAEFVSDLTTRDCKLDVWCDEKMWAADFNSVCEGWSQVDAALFAEMTSIIDKKQKLYRDFENAIDVTTQSELQLQERARVLGFKARRLSIDKQYWEYSQQRSEFEKQQRLTNRPRGLADMAKRRAAGIGDQSAATPGSRNQMFMAREAPQTPLRRNSDDSDVDLERQRRTREIEERRVQFARGVTDRRFVVGDRVDGQFRGGQRWYPGHIRRANVDGTYDIEYDDGERERDVREWYIRPGTPPLRNERDVMVGPNDAGSLEDDDDDSTRSFPCHPNNSDMGHSRSISEEKGDDNV